jgi:hypothetical protein
VGVPADLVIAIAGRWRAQQKRLGTIFGRMVPTLFGGRSAHEVTRTRGWDKPRPSRLLAALPKRSWLTRLRQLGHDSLWARWRPIASRSAATRRRWQWTWGWDDPGLRTYGHDLARVGAWDSGPPPRVVHGMDGVLWLGVIGAGPRVGPVACAVRRPDPTGPGARCRSNLGWAQGMRDESGAAWGRRGLARPAPLVVAERWGSDSQWLASVAPRPHGTVLVPGKTPYPLTLADGPKVKGAAWGQPAHGPWRQSLHAPGCRAARLRAMSPTYGAVTRRRVDKPSEERFSVFCLAADIPATRWLRVWSRRHLLAHVCRTLKALLATDVCQVHNEEAYYGPLVLRLSACFVLSYTSRVICPGHVTMDELVCNVKHHWSSVNCQQLELYGLS